MTTTNYLNISEFDATDKIRSSTKGENKGLFNCKKKFRNFKDDALVETVFSKQAPPVAFCLIALCVL